MRQRTLSGDGLRHYILVDVRIIWLDCLYVAKDYALKGQPAGVDVVSYVSSLIASSSEWTWCIRTKIKVELLCAKLQSVGVDVDKIASRQGRAIFRNPRWTPRRKVETLLSVHRPASLYNGWTRSHIEEVLKVVLKDFISALVVVRS